MNKSSGLDRALRGWNPGFEPSGQHVTGFKAGFESAIKFAVAMAKSCAATYRACGYAVNPANNSAEELALEVALFIENLLVPMSPTVLMDADKPHGGCVCTYEKGDTACPVHPLCPKCEVPGPCEHVRPDNVLAAQLLNTCGHDVRYNLEILNGLNGPAITCDRCGESWNGYYSAGWAPPYCRPAIVSGEA